MADRTGSNPADINQFQSYTGKKIYKHQFIGLIPLDPRVLYIYLIHRIIDSFPRTRCG